MVVRWLIAALFALVAVFAVLSSEALEPTQSSCAATAAASGATSVEFKNCADGQEDEAFVVSKVSDGKRTVVADEMDWSPLPSALLRGLMAAAMGLAAVLAVEVFRDRTSVTGRLPTRSGWKFNESWATNLTALGVLVTLAATDKVLERLGLTGSDIAVLKGSNLAIAAIAGAAIVAYKVVQWAPDSESPNPSEVTQRISVAWRQSTDNPEELVAQAIGPALNAAGSWVAVESPEKPLQRIDTSFDFVVEGIEEPGAAAYTIELTLPAEMPDSGSASYIVVMPELAAADSTGSGTESDPRLVVLDKSHEDLGGTRPGLLVAALITLVALFAQLALVAQIVRTTEERTSSLADGGDKVLLALVGGAVVLVVFYAVQTIGHRLHDHSGEDDIDLTKAGPASDAPPPPADAPQPEAVNAAVI